MIKTDITVPVGYGREDVRAAIADRLPVSLDEIGETEILRESLTLDGERGAYYRLTVAVAFSEEREAGLLKMKKKVFPAESYELNIPSSELTSRPIVVGAGPAGLFAALILAEAGARPIILERGLTVEDRAERIKAFESLGVLDPECNVQFGEGGAGTYSDGKLKVGGLDKYKKFVLDSFIAAGADESIAYSTSAHLGTDRLPDIIASIRRRLISLGAELIFGARMTDILVRDGRAVGITYECGRESVTLDSDTVILATGHSAHDVFSLLYKKGFSLRSKGFGIGVRLEHPREYINNLIYGERDAALLGTASYHLVSHLKSGRSVYSFCMCPGGSVVAATSAHSRVVTNGMSRHARMDDNSNAAILVSVTPLDFGSEHPLAGLMLQEKIERAAYAVSGSGYLAPSQTLASLYGRECQSTVKPSYPRGTVKATTETYLPDYITDSLRLGISDFDAWLPGYLLDSAVITGPETRTTSPIRVERGSDFSSVTVKGVYPVGEGAGYAGGIVSSARDGVMAALAILEAAKTK